MQKYPMNSEGKENRDITQSSSSTVGSLPLIYNNKKAILKLDGKVNDPPA